MNRLTPLLVLTVLALTFTGNGVVTLCGLLSLLGSEPHYHEESLGNTFCFDSGGHAHHHEGQPVPCSDYCMIDLPEATLFKVQQNKHIPFFSILPSRGMVDRQIAFRASTTGYLLGQLTYHTQAKDSSPPFTGRFLL